LLSSFNTTPAFSPSADPSDIEEAYSSAREFSNSLPDGVHVGKLFALPVGDGHAFYVVTKVNKKTVDIEWRGFSSDRWTDFTLGEGGREKRELIERLVRREDFIRKSFRQPAAAQ
jgi:hypothetical protein